MMGHDRNDGRYAEVGGEVARCGFAPAAVERTHPVSTAGREDRSRGSGGFKDGV